MLKYTLSISLLLITASSFAQLKEKDKKQQPQKPGLSVGINIGTFIIKAFEPERSGIEASARLKFNHQWFAMGEVGYENVSFDKEALAYESNGSFIRLGGDYNFFNIEEIDNNDNIIVGFRYGFAWTEYSSNRFTIKDEYWGNYTGSIGSATSTAHWGEAVFGLRSEVLKNIYMGWSVRIRSLIKLTNDDQLEPYAIPGYGKRDNKTNLSFTYNLEYHLPFSRKK